MQPFHASSDEDRVAGDSILAFIGAMGAFRERGLRVLADHGLPEPRPGEWYPLQAYLDALREIYDTNGPALIGLTGKRLVEMHRFPPKIDSVLSALETLDHDYHARHRGHDLGWYTVEQTGPAEIRVAVRNPYPCELDRCVIEALATRFRPKGAVVRVEHEGPCRRDGAPHCTLRLSW